MRRALVVVATGALLVACAAGKESGGAAPAQAPQASSPAYAQPGAYPASPMSTRPAPPPPPPQPGVPPAEPGGFAPPPSRTMQLQGAGRDFDASSRELDVAAGDCASACRALGSMDRATGVMCRLAQEGDEMRRCDDAKKKVYSARDRVKTTCGACADGTSVERNDPIPSATR